MNPLLEIDLIRLLYFYIEFFMDFQCLTERSFYLVRIFMSKLNYHIFACPLYVILLSFLRMFARATHITEII
jgi:hypothetical protein